MISKHQIWLATVKYQRTIKDFIGAVYDKQISTLACNSEAIKITLALFMISKQQLCLEAVKYMYTVYLAANSKYPIKLSVCMVLIWLCVSFSFLFFFFFFFFYFLLFFSLCRISLNIKVDISFVPHL